MDFLNIIRVAFRALVRNKMRAALTMLGIIIGVSAVVAMVSIGQGAQATVQAQIDSIGTNLLFVTAGAQNVGGVRSGTGDSGTNTLTVEDLDAIKREVPSVSMVTPAVNARGQLVAGNMNWNTSIQGVSEQYPDVRKWSVQSGEFFTDSDVKTAARVLVVGKTIADNLFAGADPIGQTIRVQNLPFRVVGVMVRKGQDAQGRDQDDVAFSPYTTVQKKILGSPRLNRLRLSGIARRDVHCATTDNGTAAPTSQAKRQRSGRFHGAEYVGYCGNGKSDQQHHDYVACVYCRSFAARGRHRHHEHHAGLCD